MKQEIEEDRLSRENDSEEENPNQTVIVNDFEKVKVNIDT